MAAMSVILALFWLAVGAACLLWGADRFMDGAGDLARALGVSALLVGIVLAGLEPEEMLTAAIAAARGAPGLALGNAIGTNITIVTLALGVAAVLAPLRISAQVRPQAIIATIASLIPILLLFTGTISRLDGVICISIFAIYTLVLIRVDRAALDRGEALERLLAGEVSTATGPVRRSRTPTERRTYALRKGRVALIGLAAMVVGGPAIVEGALRLALVSGQPRSAIGLTIVSLGTGAEMLALAVAAARRPQQATQLADLLVGGIIGSFAYNLLVTLGLAAIIHPLPVDTRITQVALPVLIATHLALLIVVWRGRVPRWMGGILIIGYLGYLIGVVLHP